MNTLKDVRKKYDDLTDARNIVRSIQNDDRSKLQVSRLPDESGAATGVLE